MFIKLKTDLKNLTIKIKQTDMHVVVIFISIAILQTVSWYFTSRRFFRSNFSSSVSGNPDADLWEFIYWFSGDTFVLLVIPVIIILLVLKKKPVQFGFSVGDYKTGLYYSVIFLAVMIPIIWFVSAAPEFAARYPHLSSAKTDINKFLVFEAGMLMYMFAWEFIWRGFTLFGLEEKFGYYAVLIQMIPFLILHNGKPALETFGAIPGGIALGILALRTRSFYYGVIVHFGVIFSIDFISRMRFNARDFGVGVDSLINVIQHLF